MCTIFNAHSGRVVRSEVLPGPLDKVCPSYALVSDVVGAVSHIFDVHHLQGAQRQVVHSEVLPGQGVPFLCAC